MSELRQAQAEIADLRSKLKAAEAERDHGRASLRRYQKPLVDGGMTQAERAWTWKQERIKRQEAERRAEVAESRLSDLLGEAGEPLTATRDEMRAALGAFAEPRRPNSRAAVEYKPPELTDSA